MKPSYTAGLAKHLLEQSGNHDIVKVETFADVGAVGHAWPPFGLKVTFNDGRAAFISFARTSSDAGDNPDLPDTFDPRSSTSRNHPSRMG